MITTARVRLSDIYRYMDLPDGLLDEINIAYHHYKIEYEKPLGNVYIEVQKPIALPEFIVKSSLEHLLSFYGMEKQSDHYGEYYR